MRDSPFTSADHERWAEANMLLRQRGELGSQVYVAERIGELAIARDWAGVERFREIAHRLDKLIRPGPIQ